MRRKGLGVIKYIIILIIRYYNLPGGIAIIISGRYTIKSSFHYNINCINFNAKACTRGLNGQAGRHRTRGHDRGRNLSGRADTNGAGRLDPGGAPTDHPGPEKTGPSKGLVQNAGNGPATPGSTGPADSARTTPGGAMVDRSVSGWAASAHLRYERAAVAHGPPEWTSGHAAADWSPAWRGSGWTVERGLSEWTVTAWWTSRWATGGLASRWTSSEWTLDHRHPPSRRTTVPQRLLSGWTLAA